MVAKVREHDLRVIRISVPLYQKVLKRAAPKGYTLTVAMEKIMESYERKIKVQDKELDRREKIIAEEIDKVVELKAGIEKTIEMGYCSICKKPLIWTFKEIKNQKKKIGESLNETSWYHESCKKESEQQG
jgi:RNase P subunit RPR2